MTADQPTAVIPMERRDAVRQCREFLADLKAKQVLTLATRRPASIRATYTALVDAIPLLRGYCYFVSEAQALEHLRSLSLSPATLRAAHWVPHAVFVELNGAMCGDSKIYSSETEAMTDLAAAWGEVHPGWDS